ncbi:hypothetical protein LINPERPRIM_LOCUS15190 [Linum perenne]
MLGLRLQTTEAYSSLSDGGNSQLTTLCNPMIC